MTNDTKPEDDLTAEDIERQGNLADLRKRKAEADMAEESLRSAQISRKERGNEADEARRPLNQYTKNIGTFCAAIAAIVGLVTGVLGVYTQMAAQRAAEKSALAEAEATKAAEKSALAMEEFRKTAAAIENLKKELELKTSTQELNYRYVTEVLTRVARLASLNDAATGGGKSVEAKAILPALQIISESNADDKGDASKESRQFMLVRMALAAGMDNEAVGFDPRLEQVKRWVEFAHSDTDATRATAIKALSRIGRIAASREDGEETFEKSVRAINDIEKLMDPETSENLAERTKIYLAKARLYESCYEKVADGVRLRAALVGWKKIGDVESWKYTPGEIANTSKEININIREADKSSTAQLAKNQAAVEEVRKFTAEVANARETTMIDLDGVVGMKLEALSNSGSEGQELIKAELAFKGERVVTPLARKLTENKVDQSIAVLSILAKMPQPLVVESEAVTLIVDQLKNGDGRIRKAAAEFLMGCWHPRTVHTIYADLEKRMGMVFDDLSKAAPVDKNGDAIGSNQKVPIENGRIAYFGSLIVGTWARTLRDTIPGPDGSGKSMNEVALDKLKQWKENFDARDAKLVGERKEAVWITTRAIIDDMTTRANLRKSRLEQELKLEQEKLSSAEAVKSAAMRAGD